MSNWKDRFGRPYVETSDEKAFKQKLDEIDRQFPSRRDDSEIQSRLREKATVAMDYDARHHTFYAEGSNPPHDKGMQLSERHLTDLDLHAEQRMMKETIPSIHERFEGKPIKAWEKGYDDLQAMAIGEHKPRRPIRNFPPSVQEAHVVAPSDGNRRLPDISFAKGDDESQFNL